METFWLKIINSKANPVFWPVLLILLIISWFYRIGLNLNKIFRTKPIRTKAAVLSVGNLTVGGTGKTPITIFLADYFLEKGKKVGVVSSGYGRQIKTDICETGREISRRDIAETGDELLEMSERLPNVCFSLAKSKTGAAQLLEKKYKVDIIIVDDGFQHRRLYRALDIILIDAGLDLRNESVFPLGRLRESLSAVERADLIFITKTNFRTADNSFPESIRKRFSDKPIVDIQFINNSLISGEEVLSVDTIVSKNCYFFAGIGNFDGLRSYIEQNQIKLAGWRQFSDHCRYSQTDIDKIKNDLEKYHPEFIITTYKDYTKLRGFDFGQSLYYLKLDLKMEWETKVVFDKLDNITGI